MPKITTGGQIKNFIPFANMNVDKFRETQSSLNKVVSQVSYK